MCDRVSRLCLVPCFLAGECQGRGSRRHSMSSPSDRDLGPLLYAPKWVRDDQRVQEVIKEIQELIEPGFHRPSPTSPVGGSVPRSLEPTLMSEVRPVPRRRSGVLVCSLLVVAAIAAPFAATKFLSAGTMATAEERSNETPSFDTRFGTKTPVL